MKKLLTAAIVTVMILSLSSIAVFAVSPSDALINVDFANGIPDGMEVVGAELVNDADKGQVLSFEGGESRTSYATLVTDTISMADFSKGITFTVWAKAASPDEMHGMAPLFTIDLTRIGYLSLCADLVVTANSDGNEDSWGLERVWSDPPSAANEVSVLEEEWVQYTVVIDDYATNLYVNGKHYEEDPFAQGSLGSIPEVLLGQMEYATGITLGSYNCDWWKYGDFKGLMSSAALYNTALSADEVKELFISTGGTYVEDPVKEETPAEEPADEAPAVDEAPVDEEPAVDETPDNDEAEDTVADADDETEAPADTTAANTSDSSDSSESSVNVVMIAIIAVAAVVIIVAVIVVVIKKKKS